MQHRPPRVLFVTSGLRLGGAERQLAILLRELSSMGSELAVVSLDAPGGRSSNIMEMGLPVRHLHLRSPRRWAAAVRDMTFLARCGGFDLVHGWMYHGSMVATALAASMRPSIPSVWSIRHSVAGRGASVPVGTRFAISACAALSARAAGIAYNSVTSKAAHESLGFRSERGRLIPNALDGIKWRPDPAARGSVRRELGLPPECPLVGMVARFSLLKGHDVFFLAAAELARWRPDVRFVLAGEGADMGNPAIRAMLAGKGLDGRIRMVGSCSEVPRLTAALDVACSCSWSEASSNAIAEALLCGVPVVATDVGDARHRLRGDDLVAPVGDYAGIARRCLDLLSRSREDRVERAVSLRRQLLEGTSPREVAAAFCELYSEAIAWKRKT